MLKCFYILIWITVFKLCFCQQKMGLGNESVLGKKYVVYFVKSQYSKADDDTWQCAGAIVTPTQILTAAACLIEMNMIYAIAGNKKYVHARDIEKDKCANTRKKKVIKISVPKEYTTSTNQQLEWMNVDIGVATVKEPYDFNDQSYLIYCSYVPESIEINYDKTNELENTRAIALGWGGKTVKGDLAKYKSIPKLLQEATTTIIDKKFCANLVPKNGSKEFVQKYLLCASGNGFLGEDDEETTLEPISEDQPPIRHIFAFKNNTKKNFNQSSEMSSRKTSLIETCQNDHGSPLTSWVGTQEMILGVALNGICNPNFDCVGPRIYVSTVSTAKIIKCLLETNDTRRKTCNEQIDDERYQVDVIEIKWPEHLQRNSTPLLSILPIGSFQRQNNEELFVRPTKDLRIFDEQEVPRGYPIDNPEESFKEIPQHERKEKQRENPFETPQEQYQENLFKNQQPNEQETRELNPYYDQQNPSLAKSQALQQFMSHQQIESQKQQEIDSAVYEPQMESYNQPPMDPYYNQPPIDSYNNQPLMESKKTPESDSFNQPQSHQPSVQQNDQNVMDPNNQLQMDIFNQQQMSLQNQPPQQINKDESTKTNQVMNNNPEIPKSNPPQIDPYMQVQSYNQQQVEFSNPQTELEPLQSPQSNFPLGQIPYSNKELPSSYSHKQIESYKPEPAESYNPLDIIMSENLSAEDASFKRPMEEPYKLSSGEPREQPSADMPPPYEQPHSAQRHQPNYAQPFRQPLEQASAQSSHLSHVSNALRIRPPPALNPSLDETQMIEQMFSQLHAGPEPSVMAPNPPEETFEEVYRNLYEGDVEEPQGFEKRIERYTGQTDANIENVPPAIDERNDEIQVRQQMPLEYPDYVVKNTNRRNT